MLAGAVGSAVSGKVNGVPTPSNAQSGTAQGQSQLDFMNTAYPGTTPWERLGNTGMSGIASSAISANAAEKQQSRQLAHERQIETARLLVQQAIATKQAKAQVLSAGSPMGVSAAKQLANALDDKPVSEYDTFVKQGRDKLPSEIDRNKSEEHRNYYSTPFSAGFKMGEDGSIALNTALSILRLSGKISSPESIEARKKYIKSIDYANHDGPFTLLKDEYSGKKHKK